MNAARVQELLDLAASEGITLPYSPETIISFEDRGLYVDLTTGFLGKDGDRFSLTVVGEAAAIVGTKWGWEE